MTGSFSPEECFTDERFDADAVRWACAFARHLEVERGLSSNTVRAYCIDIRSYLDWAARSDLDPLQVEYRRFRRYLVELNAAGYTPKTTSRRLSAIRTFFKYLNVQGVTQLNPAAATSLPKSGRDLPRKTSDADIVQLLEVCPDDPVGIRDQAFLELLYASGARIAEIARLELGDVDFSDASVRLFGKGSKERIVPLYPLPCGATSTRRVPFFWGTAAAAPCSSPRVATRCPPIACVASSSSARPRRPSIRACIPMTCATPSRPI